MFEEIKKENKVTVLGINFNSEDERKAYFREELRRKLPELKKMEGFPIGEDEDILNLSDAPYYTACPNPWLNDFIAEWEKEKAELEKQGKRLVDFEVSEPYAADVSEGKNNPIYMAHSYHTKVPHPAIMRYIMHYTQPGDVVFDGFAGTGMTGVAASMCENPKANFKYLIEKEIQNVKWGARKSICSDLSPYASLIAFGYNSVVDNQKYVDACEEILYKTEKEFSWMYKTKTKNGQDAKIIYTLWSQLLECKSCGHQQTLWNPNEDETVFQLDSEPKCLNCSVQGTVNFSTVFETYFDSIIEKPANKRVYLPVLINYLYNGKRGFKIPDKEDFELIDRTNELILNYKQQIPIFEIEKGDKTNELIKDHYNYLHQLFTSRNLISLVNLWNSLNFERGRMLITSTLTKTSSILHNVGFKNGNINLAGALPNALYVPGIFAERNILDLHRAKLKDLSFEGVKSRGIVQVASATNLSTVDSNTVDYIM